MVQCRRCELVYLSPRPDARMLPQHYPDDYTPYTTDRGLVGRLTGILRRREAAGIRRWVRPPGRILEVGCAAGDLLVPLRAQGFDVTGVEMSPYAASTARTKHGLTVHTGTLADAPVDEGAFDAVIMRSVIEHFPSPSADLRRSADLLRGGGHLFITTDNVGSLDRRVFGKHWYGFDVPRHLNLFTPRTLGRLLEATGFVVRQVRFSLVPNHWIISARYASEQRLGARRIVRSVLSLQNPVLIAGFLPVTAAQARLGCGGRMTVVAAKPA